ncbi:SGNH/GDSL hydrolase family protein [Actinoalloteichus sp. AHMU CJ021]|uniref:Lysophospholipase L1 n=2 Tax=Actinoalloteichus cyanogriseus TaxID=2893586 RepID=A0ABT1JJK5_ACTCY|nr:SGNH/GDSL hydrolase family protein [Actinoalloteichus caeruleus]AUS78301.1 SGNH/GDSL hydrolase family protein [Actinoalloteichus sp. AHMU CJ021]MCP2332369.1 Lysophospholipase L1 [Actinoalloteichus caeruleus DSM 43889]
MLGSRAIRVAAFAAGAVTGLTGAAYGLLSGQSRAARKVIGIPDREPVRADGVYLPDGTGPHRAEELPDSPAPLTFAVLGDSSAAGLGVDDASQLPAVLLAGGLAEEAERPVWLTTLAVSGSTTEDLAEQVDRAVALRPDVALVIIGANDVTTKLPLRTSAALLGAGVRRLREAEVGVVVGTCPDLGAIRPIPQPLRSIARSWSLALGRAQRRVAEREGAYPVPLADLLSPEFLVRPGELFSADRFHPSAAGYATAVSILLPPLCSVAGVWEGGPLPQHPTRSRLAEARRPTHRIIAKLNQRLRRAR